MTEAWYLKEPGGSPDGPLSSGEVVQRIGAGGVSREAAVSSTGQDPWQPVLWIELFALAFSAAPLAPLPPPPAPPPLSSSPAERGSGSMGSLPLASMPLFGSAPPPPRTAPPAGQFLPPLGSAPPPAMPYAAPGFAAPPPPPMFGHAPPLSSGFPSSPMPGAFPPAALAPASGPGPSPAGKKVALLAAAGFGALCLLVLSVVLLVRGFTGRDARIKAAIVRVTTPSGTGTGFLINGPDELVYVATAYHVINRGEPVLVERNVETSDKAYFVEAYPETEVVAFDADADLAILRVKNLRAGNFERLALAAEPVKDEKILSYGFPASSLAKRAGLVSKDGKVLSLVKFPVYDRRYGRILRDNAIDGILVSTDLEPGFSGGPTCNEAGEVAGINVTKDKAHVGQNGAVSVVVLRELLRKVKPARDKADPKPEEVAALLKQIQSEYLLLSLDDRSKVRETDFLSASELPALRRLVNEVRRQERNSDTSFIPKLKLSGQAALGIFFARLPGKSLETYLSPSTKKPISDCELASQRLASFLDTLGTGSGSGSGSMGGGKHEESATQANYDGCDELAFRPLAWDLTAATLQWDGKEKDYSVTKIDRVDDEGTSYRTSVRISGAPSLIEVWVGLDQGKLRLKLFDDAENLYAIKSAHRVPGSAFSGSWWTKSPRVTDFGDRDMEIETTEKLSVSVTDEHTVALRHVVTHHYFVPEGKKGAFRCNQKSTIETGLAQSFTGTLDNGVIIALPQKDAERVGADGSSCVPKYTADRILALKLVGSELYMVRTNGVLYPESKAFTKE